MEILRTLLHGLGVTLLLTVAGGALAMLLALVAGLARSQRQRWLSLPATLYVELFRGTSALIQLYWAVFALPLLGVDVPALAAGICVLGLNAGAYGAEVVRGALAAVPAEQWEAARVLGLSARDTWSRVIMPQALVRALPPLNNVLIELLKNTSLASMITLSDLTFEAQSLRAATLNSTQIFAALLAIYFVLSMVCTGCFRWLERRAHERLGDVRGGA
jgi:polar amino acid transport system permease protein